LAGNPGLLNRVARSLVDSQFPPTIAPDVSLPVGLSPDDVLGTGHTGSGSRRRGDPRWRWQILIAWDRQRAFCGYDGQLSGATVGIDAAHVRWFAFDGADELDNGLASAAGTTSCSTSACWVSMTETGSVCHLHSPRGPRPGERSTTSTVTNCSRDQEHACPL
jgi:hypothetical protein